MSISRIKVWNGGDILTAADLNAEFNNIINNGMALWSPAQSNVNFNGKVVTWDAAANTTLGSTQGTGWVLSPGSKSGGPFIIPTTALGSQLDIASHTFTDLNSNNAAPATAFAGVIIHPPTLAATNAGVTTTDAATLYIPGPPTAGANETITNGWALWLGGQLRLDGPVIGTYAPWSTGDVKPTFKTVADAGFVMMNDGTIGNASSGATTRANVDTQALFILLWNNIPDAWASVVGGRGASASADYNANKAITLPRTLGRALAVAGAGTGLTARTLGSYLGAQDSLVPLHTHSLNDPGHAHTEQVLVDDGGGASSAWGPAPTNTDSHTHAASSTGVNTTTNGTGITVLNTGSSPTDANMPPTFYLNIMIKL